jgi:single-strand DNA-binding protein
MSINVLVLVGHAGRDPELRFFASGSCVCEFTLAVNRPPKDGQAQDPLWVSCKAWGKTAQVAGDYLRKGSKVALVGRLEIEQWSDRSSGELRSKPLVVIDRLELCGGTPNGATSRGAGLTGTASASSATALGAGPGLTSSGATSVSEEEVPF